MNKFKDPDELKHNTGSRQRSDQIRRSTGKCYPVFKDPTNKITPRIEEIHI